MQHVSLLHYCIDFVSAFAYVYTIQENIPVGLCASASAYLTKRADTFWIEVIHPHWNLTFSGKDTSYLCVVLS